MTTATNLANQNVDEAFLMIANEFDLKSGDISAEQLNQVNKLKAELAKLLSEHIFNNLERS